MTCKSIGGSSWRYNSVTGAGQIGITGGRGLNNVGTLARVFGVVSAKLTGDSGDIRISDGSGPSIQVMLPAGVSRPWDGYYATITGVISLAKSGTKISPLLLAREVEWRPHAPDSPVTAVGMPADSPGQICLRSPWPEYTDRMNLYRSSDGLRWTPVDVAVERDDLIDGPYGIAYVSGDANAYYRFTAENAGGESPPTESVYARPLVPQETSGVVIDAPYNGQVGVSRIPTFQWHAAWSQPAAVKWYDCRVRWMGAYDVWQVRTATTPPVTSLVYGQTQDVTVIIPWQGQMFANTNYVFEVRAFDTGNWQFASGTVSFTTGP